MNFLTSVFHAVAAGFASLRHAIAVSRALEQGRAPGAPHLRALGIDPKAFASIGHG